jgi:hypothetical protein
MIDNIKDKVLNFVETLFGRVFGKKSMNETNVIATGVKTEEETSSSSISSNGVASNALVKTGQVKMMMFVLCVAAVGLFIIVNVVHERKQATVKEEVNPNIKVEVAADSVDVDKLWPNRIEEQQRKMRIQFEEKIKSLEDSLAEKERLMREENKVEMEKLTAQLAWAKTELNKASIEIERVGTIKEDASLNSRGSFSSEITNTSFATDREFDKPKSINDYIPEGAYVSGYTMTGLAVSTGLNAPTENATPIVIRLTNAGNLPTGFRANMSNCRILGSGYGDLSSERAKIRLEKLICTDESKGLVTTTEIAGTIYGPDGMDGIKGKVIATSNRHIRNALTGGIIGGLASSAKGQDSATITSSGLINTKKKGFGQMAGEGVLAGTSNAADKVADYYLRQAEAMSPVLTIPAGIKVDAVFTKGVYFGELGTRRKIKDLRTKNERTEAKRELDRNDVY